MPRYSSSSSSSSGGIGLIGGLTLLFVALKLTGYIQWSWVWVLSPIWITLLIAGLFIAGIAAVVYYLKDQRDV